MTSRLSRLLLICGVTWAAGPPGLTSLTNPQVKYRKADTPTITLRRGPIEAVVADNSAFGAEHRAGYNGIASLVHRERRDNVFVSRYAGLNYELILDGTDQPRDIMFEPRRAPMELRQVSRHAVELYQAATPHWKLESCTRFELEKDGAIRMTFECIPRARTFHNGYIGLFWASYIQAPESLAIHFPGRERGEAGEKWIEAISPRHGVESTHAPAAETREYRPAEGFPAHWMAFSFSRYLYTQPFYYGLRQGMAAVMMFRPEDRIAFAQSPSGGGPGNPAWDFVWFIPDYQVDRAYGFEMGMAYVPFRTREEIQKLYERRRWRR